LLNLRRVRGSPKSGNFRTITRTRATGNRKLRRQKRIFAERPQDNAKKATNALYAAIDPLGQVDGVPDKKKALTALKEAKRKLDVLYRDVTSRKATKATSLTITQ
jgi:hypothetical protein